MSEDRASNVQPLPKPGFLALPQRLRRATQKEISNITSQLEIGGQKSKR